MTLKLNNATVNELYLNHNVGYTVVGSPTIVDGVASDFGPNNYVSVSKPSAINIFFLKIIFSFSALNSYQFIFGDQTHNGIQLLKNNDENNTIRMRYGNGSTSKFIDLFQNPNLNTMYEVHILTTGTSAILSFGLKGIPQTVLSQTLNYVPVWGTGKWVFGKRAISEGEQGYLRGSIDLNLTRIKIDNITWFNGKQQASPAVNALQINGNTVWQR